MDSLLKAIESYLQEYGFVPQGLNTDCDFCHEEEDLQDYGDWQIALEIPNGGILAADIIHKPTGGWWGCLTYEKFGYYDDDGIIAFAKQVIDEVEQQLAVVPGQLSLFEVEV